MTKKILIAPNSYKECADSITAADFFSKYLKIDENYIIVKRPVSDGGDGFLKVCQNRFNLKILKYQITTPYDNSTFSCSIGYSETGKQIFIESAEVLGLKIIPKEKRHPISLSSIGMGELIKLIMKDVETGKIEVEKIIIGIGGTGTNDLGVGMLSVFGWKFYDIAGKPLAVIPQNFSYIKEINGSKIYIPFKIEAVVDVINPLLGPNGATNVFGLQKGCSNKEIKIIESGFENILNIIYNNKLTASYKVLSGAGGGLAAGLVLFFGARIKTASDFIINDLGTGILREQINFLITGEGSFDKQSLMRKGTGILIDLFEDYAEKIFLCCGKIDESIKGKLASNVIPIELTKYFNNDEESLNNFEKGIELAGKEIIDILRL